MGTSISRSPRNLPELWEWVTDEIRRLNRRRFLNTGTWVIEEQGGVLVARNSQTGSVTVLAEPD